MLNTTTHNHMLSPLKQTRHLKPVQGKAKKSIVVPMMLTSLVDAFTIVVIYLIINSSTSEAVTVEDGLKLPQAEHSQIVDQSPIVVFKNNQYLIDNQIVSEQALRQTLEQLKAKSQGLFKTGDASIIVQADENIDFDRLQPLLVASSYAGIKHVKFAVLQKE